MDMSMAMRTVDDAKRTSIVALLDQMDSDIRSQMPMVQLPLGNDTWMALSNLRQALDTCRRFVAVMG